MAATGGSRRRDLQHINLVYSFLRALHNHLPVLVVVTRQRCHAADGADFGVVVLEELRRFVRREEGADFFREGGHGSSFAWLLKSVRALSGAVRHEDAWALAQRENGMSACRCNTMQGCGARQQLCDNKAWSSRLELKYGFHLACTRPRYAWWRRVARRHPRREKEILLASVSRS